MRGLPVSYPQSVLTLSAGPRKGADGSGSLTDGLLGRLVQRLRLAQARHDHIAVILLQQRIRAELAR